MEKPSFVATIRNGIYVFDVVGSFATVCIVTTKKKQIKFPFARTYKAVNMLAKNKKKKRNAVMALND